MEALLDPLGGLPGQHRRERPPQAATGVPTAQRAVALHLRARRQGRCPARGRVRQRRLRALHQGRARAVAWWGQLSHRAPHKGDPERPAEANWSACARAAPRRAASPRATMSAGSATRPMIASCHLMPHGSRPAPAAMWGTAIPTSARSVVPTGPMSRRFSPSEYLRSLEMIVLRPLGRGSASWQRRMSRRGADIRHGWSAAGPASFAGR
jgi:hypothetical protein